MKSIFQIQRWFSKRLRIAAVALLVIPMLGLLGCSRSTEITTTAAGHLIHIDVKGKHSINSQSDQGTISTPEGKITIERSRVKFDDAQWTAIPEGAAISVKISKGTLWLSVGSVTIKRTVSQ